MVRLFPREDDFGTESALDLFHIGMRIELLRKVVMPVTYQEYLEDRLLCAIASVVSRDWVTPCGKVD